MTGQSRAATSSRAIRARRRKSRPRWVRILRSAAAWTFTGFLVLGTIGAVALAIQYSRLTIPAPADFALFESSTFYYADQEHVLGRLGTANREPVAISDLPEYVPWTVVAAEDRSFYTNPGIDAFGMMRAMFNTVVLGNKQGGSTITQQYVERYYVGETTTDVRGKIDEALLALKIDQQQDKDRILENYMNTIYFGRGAYGIQAASRAYFGHDASTLTLSESALLAGIIPRPSGWDPRFDPVKAEERWNYVLDGMVEKGWLTPAERLKLTFPATVDFGGDDVYGGPEGYILREAVLEVENRLGISAEDIETRGYRIVTSIDWADQQAAQDAATILPDDHSPNLRLAIVVVEPGTGAILAMYGGADYLTVQRNAVTQDICQAGSTFKPFALIGALEHGVALESEYNGNSPLPIDGFDRPVRNFGNTSFGQISLIKATANSVNTVYAQVTHDIGPATVVDVATRAGLPADTAGLEANPANVLGTASPHPIDMAEAYATIAANGFHAETFLVQSVTGPSGDLVYEHQVEGQAEFTSAVMAEAQYAMQQVVNSGSGGYASRLGRPIAGKTGTSSDNQSAWFIGFTPQVVGAVAMYQVGEDGSVETITPFGGFRQITGGSWPVRVWTAMMEKVFADLPVEQFPPRSHIGTVTIPSPSPGPAPSPTPSPSVVEPTVDVTPTPPPSPSP